MQPNVYSIMRRLITQPDQAIHIIESSIGKNSYEELQEHIEGARRDVLNKYNIFPMICDIIHKDQSNFDGARYVKQRMLPGFSKSFAFLFKYIGDKFIRDKCDG